ncbi:hypothetical protein JCM14076_21790 [Methylosoma difficile]
MKRYAVALIPLAVLLTATLLACVVGYFIQLAIGDTLPFRKILSKTTQVFLVLSIFPFLAYLKMGKAELGFAPRPVFFKQLWQGFALGLLTLLPVFAVLIALDVHVVDVSQPWTAAWLLEKTTVSLLLALLISVLEEPLFRGLILIGLARKLPLAAALAISAFYYAALHFIDSKTEIPAAEFNFFSGFKLLGEAFANLLNPDIQSAFLALFMVGLFLGLLRTRQATSLGWCIGCHTAWVWLIKLSKALFNTNPQADYFYLVSSYDGVVGYLVMVWLAGAMAAFGLFRRGQTVKKTA